jgi:hypothetical protein
MLKHFGEWHFNAPILPSDEGGFTKFWGFCEKLRALMWIILLGAFADLRKAIIILVRSYCLSACPFACNNSAPTGRIFMKFGIHTQDM